MHAGIWGRTQVRKIAVQAELLYVPKAWAIKTAVGNKVDMNYVVLPIIVQFQPNRLGVGIGPELSFLLKRSNKGLVLANSTKTSLGLAFDLAYQLTNKWRINLRTI